MPKHDDQGRIIVTNFMAPNDPFIYQEVARLERCGRKPRVEHTGAGRRIWALPPKEETR